MATVTERQERYRKDRREKGLCGWSGCKHHSGDEYYCHAAGTPDHRSQHRQRMQRNRDAKRTA